TAESTPSTATGLRVLVVEDHAETADALATLVRVGGHGAEVAPDARSALEAARSCPPDVVLPLQGGGQRPGAVGAGDGPAALPGGAPVVRPVGPAGAVAGRPAGGRRQGNNRCHRPTKGGAGRVGELAVRTEAARDKRDARTSRSGPVRS